MISPHSTTFTGALSHHSRKTGLSDQNDPPVPDQTKKQYLQKTVQFKDKLPWKIMLKHSTKPPRQPIEIDFRSIKDEIEHEKSASTSSMEESSSSLKTPPPEEQPIIRRNYFNPFAIGANEFLSKQEK